MPYFAMTYPSLYLTQPRATELIEQLAADVLNMIEVVLGLGLALLEHVGGAFELGPVETCSVRHG